MSISKGIEYDQRKIDAKLSLGDSLDLSNGNGSESPSNARNYRRNMTCETEGDVKKKKTPIHEIYTDLIKKHLKEDAGATWKRTPLGGRKLNSRPQTCKNSFVSPKDFRNLVSTKNEVSFFQQIFF